MFYKKEYLKELSAHNDCLNSIDLLNKYITELKSTNRVITIEMESLKNQRANKVIKVYPREARCEVDFKGLNAISIERLRNEEAGGLVTIIGCLLPNFEYKELQFNASHKEHSRLRDEFNIYVLNKNAVHNSRY